MMKSQGMIAEDTYHTGKGEMMLYYGQDFGGGGEMEEEEEEEDNEEDQEEEGPFLSEEYILDSSE